MKKKTWKKQSSEFGRKDGRLKESSEARKKIVGEGLNFGREVMCGDGNRLNE